MPVLRPGVNEVTGVGGPGPVRRVRDFPADAERLTAEEPTGVRHVLVNGTPIRSDGRSQLDALERRPGMWPEIA